MDRNNSLDALTRSLAHASYEGLADVAYESRDFEATRNWTREQKEAAVRDNSWPVTVRHRRPDLHECEVLAMFMQMWGSTSLGFGGIGGSAMTRAYTVVLQGPMEDVAVYWNGRHAYTLTAEELRAKGAEFFELLGKGETVSVKEARTRFTFNDKKS